MNVRVDSIQRMFRLIVVVVCVSVTPHLLFGEPENEQSQNKFSDLVEQLSEPSGEFDTDNLISNEKSYLHVIPQLEQRGVTGGVYIGVGPDQNFSYIARIRPDFAFVVDIRRDNLLLHLLFKALFASSRNRAEYLCQLTGRPVPDDIESWGNASLDRIISYVDGAKHTSTVAQDRRLHDAIQRFGIPVSASDFATIDRFHAAFVDAGLSLRFNSTGRQPQSYYPNYRELLTETDRDGHRRSFLATEMDFQFIRDLELQDRIIPVVGDLGGTRALTAIGRWMADHNQKLSAFYVSNVENYLFRDDNFQHYIENLRRLPHDHRSVIIRAIFGRFSLPESVPGYYSTSTVISLEELLDKYAAGKYRTYRDLVIGQR